MTRKIERVVGGIKINDQQFSINIVEDFVPPDEEYTIHIYQYLDSNGGVLTETDGCEFEILPNKSTRVMTIVEQNYNCDRLGTKSNGYALINDPISGVICYEVGPHLGDRNPVISLSRGNTDCFIAGDETTKVIDVSSPPFKPNYEREITVNTNFDALCKPISPEYWHYYHTLRSGNKAEIAKLKVIRPDK